MCGKDEMSVEQAEELTRFERCAFGPDSDPCEYCGANEKQLWYRRTSYDTEEGEYRCQVCVMLSAEGLSPS